jgi:hypothetical protein
MFKNPIRVTCCGQVLETTHKVQLSSQRKYYSIVGHINVNASLPITNSNDKNTCHTIIMSIAWMPLQPWVTHMVLVHWKKTNLDFGTRM